MVDARQFDQMEAEMSMNANLHLVPCRWERSGWRYVQLDPGNTRFFNNPNRVNNFGVGAEKRRFASQNRMDSSFYQTANRSAFKEGGQRRGVNQTTYGSFFAQGQR